MRRSAALASLSGLLYVFSFAPWDFAHLQWFAFLPLLLATESTPRSSTRIFLLGMIPSAIITFGGFYWMVHATQQYGGLPFGAACSILILFSLVNQLQIPAYLLARRFVYESFLSEKKGVLKSLGLTVLLAVIYCGIESACPKLFLDTAGHAFYRSPWVRQWADLGGPFGITFLILAVNELLYLWIRTRLPGLLAVLGIGCLLVSSYGILRIREFNDLPPTELRETFRISLIQANIGDYLKLASERGGHSATEEVMDRYLRLSSEAETAMPTPDAVVWPETAYPSIFGQPKTLLETRMHERLTRHLEKASIPYLIGGYDSNSAREEFNSLFFISPGARVPETYHKSILLMFGETLPFSDVFPSMKSWFPTMGFFGRGPGPRLFELKNREGTPFQFAPSICYEGLFSDYSATGALKGADALINVTNDSWFGPHGEPYLHLALTQFRAIETRLPLIRSTNTGISAIIDPLGETRAISGIGTEEIVRGEIGRNKMKMSPYLRMAQIFGGNWLPRFCQGSALLALLYLRFRRYRPA